MPDEKTDKEITCKDCRRPFIWTAGEQAYFAEKGFDKVPKRCVPCRRERRVEMAERRVRSDR